MSYADSRKTAILTDFLPTHKATLEELAHLLVPLHRLHIEECVELGVGHYGEVVLGILLDETSAAARDVAVKRLKATGTRGERVRLAKRLARELNVWAKVQHPNIVELIGYYLDDKYESPLLISAFMPNGNVLEYIERDKPGIERRVALVKGITAGLACLHNFDPPICHGDLKPANVLIDLHMNAVLCDFGLASFVSGSETSPGLVTSTTIKGTARYMSPELYLHDNCMHSLESDVWAWACTAFHVLTGSIPYANSLMDPQLCMSMIRKERPGDIDLILPNNFEGAASDSAFDLWFLHSAIPQCWDFEPRSRPTMCTLHSKIHNLSSESDTAAVASDGVGPGASSAGAKLPKTSKAPSGKRAEGDNDAQGDRITGVGNAPHGGEVAEESAREGREKTETKVDTNDDEPSNEGGQRYRVIGAYPQGDSMAEENMADKREQAAMKDVAGDEWRNEDQNGADNEFTNIASDRPPSQVSTPALSKSIFGVASIIALSAIAHRLLQISDSSPLSHPPTSRPDFPSNVPTQSLSIPILASACILSLCANIYFISKKLYSQPSETRQNLSPGMEID
ncbi:hypothetical protein FS837_011687 [Tulasnella sp. UAMH 9824]|nr:hypothetical protein FS837_011687 [Tulasnella sp. UAMH 9824]